MTPKELRAALKLRDQPKREARLAAKQPTFSRRPIHEGAVAELVQGKIDALTENLAASATRDRDLAAIAALRSVIYGLAVIDTAEACLGEQA